MAIKLCISTYSLSGWRRQNNRSLDDSLRWIAGETDVRGVEFAGLDAAGDADPVRRAGELRKLCDKLGLTIPSFCVGAELLRPAGEQANEVARLKTLVDAARALGVRSMRHDVTRGFGDNANGFNVPHTFAGALKVVVPAIREVADYARKYRIKTSLENHGFFMQHSRRVEQLLDAVDHPNFALTMDMGNFLCVNENPLKAVERLAHRAVMVHVKDFHVRPKSAMPPSGWFATPTRIALRGAIVGHGVIDIPAQLRVLKSAGYRGWLSLEFEGMEEPTAAIHAGLAYLGKLIKDG
jgi:sugar phosphate isomerase/epimerase